MRRQPAVRRRLRHSAARATESAATVAARADAAARAAKRGDDDDADLEAEVQRLQVSCPSVSLLWTMSRNMGLAELLPTLFCL